MLGRETLSVRLLSSFGGVALSPSSGSSGASADRVHKRNDELAFAWLSAAPTAERNRGLVLWQGPELALLGLVICGSHLHGSKRLLSPPIVRARILESANNEHFMASA